MTGVRSLREEVGDRVVAAIGHENQDSARRRRAVIAARDVDRCAECHEPLPADHLLWHTRPSDGADVCESCCAVCAEDELMRVSASTNDAGTPADVVR